MNLERAMIVQSSQNPIGGHKIEGGESKVKLNS